MSRAGLVVITSSVVLLALVATNPMAVAYGAPVSVMSSAVTESTSGSPVDRFASLTSVSTSSTDGEDLEPRFLDFLGDVVQGVTQAVNTVDKVKNTVNTVEGAVKNTVNTVQGVANSLKPNGGRPTPPAVKKPARHHHHHHHRRPRPRPRPHPHHHHRKAKLAHNKPTHNVVPTKIPSLRLHPSPSSLYRTKPIVPPGKIMGGSAAVIGEKKPSPNTRSTGDAKSNAKPSLSSAPSTAGAPKPAKPVGPSTSAPAKKSGK